MLLGVVFFCEDSCFLDIKVWRLLGNLFIGSDKGDPSVSIRGLLLGADNPACGRVSPWMRECHLICWW